MTRRFISPVPVLLAGGALALGLAGCAPADTSEDAAASGGEPALRIVAGTTHTAEFAQRVAGDLAEVTPLIQPNQSAHSFDPSAADLAALGEADVLVINGLGLEEWLDDAVEASGFNGTTIDSSELVELIEYAEGDGHDEHSDEEGDEHGDEHSEEEGDEHGEEHSDEEAGEHSDEENGDEHGHDGDDPHIWTSASNAVAMVEAIAAGFAEVDADNAETYEANAEAYIAQLEQLDAWIVEAIEQVDPSERLLVTNHEAFGYFVDAYDVTYVGAIIPSFDDNAEVSAADIDDLVDAVRDTGATAVFSETTLSPAAAETIANEAGVTVYGGDEGLYGDSLGPAGSPGETYIASMVHNVTVLVDAWGATAPAVPDALTE